MAPFFSMEDWKTGSMEVKCIMLKCGNSFMQWRDFTIDNN